MKPPVVLISSIRERRESLDQLLQGLDQQTLAHDRIILGAGYDLQKDLPQAKFQLIEPIKRGCGNRWRSLEFLLQTGQIAEDDIVINIDDDMRAYPHALQATVREFTTLESEKPLVLVYAGSSEDLVFHHFQREVTSMRRRRTPPIPTLTMIRFPACLMCFRAKDIIGISKVTDADILLGPGGDDETLLSRHFWEKGLRVLRSGEWCPYVISLAGFDEHSLWRQPKPIAVQEARSRCFEAYTGIKKAPW